MHAAELESTVASLRHILISPGVGRERELPRSGGGRHEGTGCKESVAGSQLCLFLTVLTTTAVGMSGMAHLMKLHARSAQRQEEGPKEEEVRLFVHPH